METRQATIVAVSTFFFSFSSIFVAFYFTSCLFVVKKLRLPEYLMFLAWVSRASNVSINRTSSSYGKIGQMLDFGMAFSLFYAVGKGFGLHTRQIKPQNEVALNKATYVFQVLYVGSNPIQRLPVSCTHAEIMLFYLSFVEGPNIHGRQKLRPGILPSPNS